MPGGNKNIRPEDNTAGFQVNPQNAGRPKGKKNRSTILKKWIETAGEIDAGTQEDEIVLALIQKAKAGDVGAFKEIMDTLYGKVPDKAVNDLRIINPIPIKFSENGSNSKSEV